MKTISLRFSNNFAPAKGTIAAHQELINHKGYVWYGKLGIQVSAKVAKIIMDNVSPRILLIHSGSVGRYWANVDRVQNGIPPLEEIPEYYRNMASDFKTWFRVIAFEDAPKNILSLCTVDSSGVSLSDASKHSMSPYFIINVYDEAKR
jgi:hypothetical protein